MYLHCHTILLFPFATVPLQLTNVLSGIYTKFVPFSRHIRMSMKAAPMQKSLTHPYLGLQAILQSTYTSPPPHGLAYKKDNIVKTCIQTYKGRLSSIQLLCILIQITFAESISLESHIYVLSYCCHSITCIELHPGRRWVGRRSKSMLPNEQIIVQCKA